MTPERWVKVQEIFAEALERKPDERGSYLTTVCTDESLRQEVELMIAAHEQEDSGFLELRAQGSNEGLRNGTKVGQYEVIAAIGAGGMGEVYRARDTKLGRDVAIKVLPAAFARDAERLVRFQREATFLASLNHPNIASIYGLEDSSNMRALVMELVEGPTLAERIKTGPIPLDEALPVARQICEALEYAHERGVVHRDLKPANVKVSREDSVKILDFGLAKAVHGEAEAKSAGDSPTLSEMATRAGFLLGTAAYMSPEQAKGKPVDRRADIWAFGCVLYEILTGKKAFAGDGVTETLASVLNSEPDWSLLPSATRMHVRVLLKRCLQKDAKQRLRDIGDARIALDEVLSGAAEDIIGPAASSPVWRRALPWTLAASSFVALVAFAFVYFHQRPPIATHVLRYEIFPPEKTFILSSSFAISPDGKHLAFDAVFQGRPQLWIRDLDSLESRPLPAKGAYPFWSPDSRSLAFFGNGKLERMDLSGGAPQVICPVSVDFGQGAWGPSGDIVFGTNHGLMKVSAAGGPPSLLIRADRASGQFAVGNPFMLPDGRHFLYTAPSSLTNSGTAMFLGSLDAGKEQQPSKPLANGTFVAYVSTPGSGSGRVLFLQPDRTLMVQDFNVGRAQLEGDPVPVAEGVNRFTVSDNGVLAYLGGTSIPLQLGWFNRQGKMLGTLGEPGDYPSPAISPDGRTVAVPRLGAKGSDLWLYDLAHGTGSRFTFDEKIILFPVWSPDSNRIAFFSTRPGNPTIYQKPVNGMSEEEPVEKALTNDSRMPLDWSRDGHYLIEGVTGDTSSIWMLQLTPGQARGESKSVPWLKDRFNEVNARLSPNGGWMAYDSDETGRDEIFVQTFPKRGGKWQVSSNGGTRPVWSRDGKELYFIASDGNLMAMDVRSGPAGGFDVSPAKALFNPHTGGNRTDTFDVDKKGRFLIPTVIQQSTPITVVMNWQAALKR